MGLFRTMESSGRPDPVILLACLLAAAGCSTPANVAPPVGTGWSRAPDLSVYGALGQAAVIAQEHEILCDGQNPALVEDRWRSQFGARHDWIAAALAERYGADRVAASQRPLVTREPCPSLSEDRWRRHYGRLLRLLELRLYPRDYWSRP